MTDLDDVRAWGKNMVDRAVQSGDSNLPPFLIMTTPLRHMAIVLNRYNLEEGSGLSAMVEGICIPLVRRHVATAAALIVGTWVLSADPGYAWVAAPGDYDALTMVVMDAHYSEYLARSIKRRLDEGPAVGEWVAIDEHLSPASDHIQRAIRSSLN
jgi:hypothetical protein